MRRGKFDSPVSVGGDQRFRILAVTDGEMSVAGDPSGMPMKLSDTMLLPACLGPTELTPEQGGVEVLEIFVP